MKQIISASRRTDIPAFYYDWFQEALKNKKVTISNPVYEELKHEIDLSPENIHSIVLWSKNFKNVLKSPQYLEDYNLYFQYTITNYSKALEPNVPEYSESIKTLEGLLKKYKPEQFNIRFDPIILSLEGEIEPDKEKIGRPRLKAFERLLCDLKALGMENCRVTTSYVSLYKKTEIALKNAGIHYLDITPEVQVKFMQKMSEIAQKYNRDIFVCANDIFVEAGISNVKKGHCIDGELLENLFGKCTKAHAPGQRLECGCTKSRDIGMYLPCKHKCVYCYARNE